MSNISPLGPSNAAALAKAGGGLRPVTTPAASPRDGDRVELSGAAQLLSRMAELPVRQELVDRVKAQIANGSYDTSDKIEALLDNLAHDLA